MIFAFKDDEREKIQGFIKEHRPRADMRGWSDTDLIERASVILNRLIVTGKAAWTEGSREVAKSFTRYMMQTGQMTVGQFDELVDRVIIEQTGDQHGGR